ncbi:MAG: GNAT family N-acetyltransferase, partial [Deltaproteobacteria bacterium]|nr:GNAT family N-acetyltransferase [Deltaproteobacteria bacterium]
GRLSRIVPMLSDTAVVVPRGDVHYVVTEYGAVNLFGKSLQERALGMISIAHPKFREELFFEAKKMGLFSPERTLKDSIRGVYPVKYEETYTINNQQVTIRPAKPVDERRIQEHFYTLDKNDVISRFFHEKSSFFREEVEGITQIDYIKNLTIVAVVGEFGFGKVVAIGEYLLDPDKNMAEIAFSVSKDWQRKGLGKIIIHKLAEAAKENHIDGFYAYTIPQNQAMIKLFKSLPCTVQTTVNDDVLVLSCRLNQLLSPLQDKGKAKSEKNFGGSS